jgi:hypothetical protein
MSVETSDSLVAIKDIARRIIEIVRDGRQQGTGEGSVALRAKATKLLVSGSLLFNSKDVNMLP